MRINKIFRINLAKRVNSYPSAVARKTAYVDTIDEIIKTKPIEIEAYKNYAWWRAEYREAKAIESAIKNGTYNLKFYQPIYHKNGRLNMNIFHPNWDPYGEDGLI